MLGSLGHGSLPQPAPLAGTLDLDEAFFALGGAVALGGAGVDVFIDVTGGNPVGVFLRVLEADGVVEFGELVALAKVEAFVAVVLVAGVLVGLGLLTFAGEGGFEFVPEGFLLFDHFGLVTGGLDLLVAIVAELGNAGLVAGVVVADFGLGGRLAVALEHGARVHLALDAGVALCVIQSPLAQACMEEHGDEEAEEGEGKTAGKHDGKACRGREEAQEKPRQ